MEEKKPSKKSGKSSANNLRQEDDFALPTPPPDMPLRRPGVNDQKIMEKHIALHLPGVMSQPDFRERRRIPDSYKPFVWRD
jgi:hypothetical protein